MRFCLRLLRLEELFLWVELARLLQFDLADALFIFLD